MHWGTCCYVLTILIGLLRFLLFEWIIKRYHLVEKLQKKKYPSKPKHAKKIVSIIAWVLSFALGTIFYFGFVLLFATLDIDLPKWF